MTATTALTAQNTQGVSAIHHIPPSFVLKQIDTVLNDIGVDIVKTGMLASAETVDAVADILKRHGNPRLVLDPVMMATFGAQLLPDDAVRNLREKLLPLATILTPNLPEAKLLLQNVGVEPPDTRSVSDLVDIARQVQQLGPKWVLLKGGHLPLTRQGRISEAEADRHLVVNVLCGDTGATTLLETDYIESRNTHGTGCSLACMLNSPLLQWGTASGKFLRDVSLIDGILLFAAALASRMVCDPESDMVQHTESACQYIEMGIRTNINARLGHGSGPINHFHHGDVEARLRVRAYES